MKNIFLFFAGVRLNFSSVLFQLTGCTDPQPNWQPEGTADVRGVPGAREECGVTAVSSFVRMRCVFHA